MDAFEILVVILSVFLAIFLVLGIIFLYLLIKIAKKVRVVTEKAESVAANIASASQMVRPAVVSGAIAKFVKNVMNSSRTKKGAKDDG